MILNSPYISGSLTVTGNIITSGSITLSGSVASASYALDSTNASSASYVDYTNVVNKPSLVSSSQQILDYNVFATTGSNTFVGSQTISGSVLQSGSLNVNGSIVATGQIVAQTLNVQQVTSSIVYSSGSNVFGNSLSNTQQFTGSLQVTGSSHYLLGNVGIGVVSPNLQMELGGGTSINTRIRLNRGSDDTQQYSTIGWNSFNVHRANVSISGNQTDFSINQIGSDGTRTPFHINTTGNVGIGTISPQGGGGALDRTLSINSGAGAASFLTGLVGDIKYSTLFTANNIVVLETNAAIPLAFNTNNTERMRITSGGNILINQTADVAGLSTSIQMSGTGTSNPATQASYHVYAWHGSSNPTWRGYYIFNKSRGSSIGSYAAVANNDHLGTIRWNGADGSGLVVGAEINAFVDGTPGVNDMPTRLTFSTTADGASSPTDRMTINSVGNVGIGTTSPSAPLTIQSSGATGILLEQDVSNSGVSSRLVARNNSIAGTIRYDTGGWRFNTGATLNETSGTERILISTDGYLRMLSSTGGIQFQGNTGASNALNAYETGTWTPQLYWNNGASYVMGSGNGGNYVRVGNIVTLNFTMVWGSLGAGSTGGGLRISGIPYVCGSYRSAGTISAISAGSIGGSSSVYTWHTLTIDPGAAFIYWIENAPNGTYSHNPSVATGGTVYSLQLTYII